MNLYSEERVGPLEKRRQLRIRATVIASIDYVLNLAILSLFFALGRVDLLTVITVLILSVLANTLFLYLVISGKSEFFDDPSLTRCQVTAGCIINLVALFLAPQVAYAIAINMFIPLAYGSLHFKREGFILAWILVSIAFGTILYFTKDLVAAAPQTPLDTYLFALVVSTALGRFLFINAEVSNIRRRLQEKNKALQKAHGLLKEVTEKDELTGMANRHAFKNILLESCNPILGTKCLYLVILEVGNITQANDHFSHEKAIRAVSDILTCRLRRSDTISRYDDTQFALLLPESPKHAVTRVLERAQMEIEDINWEYYGVNPAVSTMISIVEWHKGDDPLEILARCETELAAMKNDDLPENVLAPAVA
ncbi:MAG: diguanylate cyclase [Agarilytica sp.]